jgi:hypothetical protein
MKETRTMMAVTAGRFPRSDPAPLNSEVLPDKDELVVETNVLGRLATFCCDVVALCISCCGTWEEMVL